MVAIVDGCWSFVLDCMPGAEEITSDTLPEIGCDAFSLSQYWLVMSLHPLNLFGRKLQQPCLHAWGLHGQAGPLRGAMLWDSAVWASRMWVFVISTGWWQVV